MEITRYKRAECKRLLDDDAFWAAGPLPTSRLRLASYVHNPRAGDDDVLLYTAHKDGDLVSYIAVLPDFMQTNNGTEVLPFGWPSSWWSTQDASLGPGASVLLFKVLADWQGAIGLSGFSEVARVVYDASRRFRDMKIFDLCGYAIYLPREFKGRRIPGAPINAVLRLKNRIYSSRAASNGAEWELVDRIDAAVDRFLKEQTRHELFSRDGDFFNWLISYPWVSEITTEDRQAGSEMHRYFFASRAARFAQLPVRLTRDDEVIGFLFFTFKNDFLTLKYAIYPDAEIGIVKECIQAMALKYGVSFLWCADDRLNKMLQADRLFFLACKHVPVPFYVGKQIEYDPAAHLQYGLGDRVMT